jgi:hypothetical protein
MIGMGSHVKDPFPDRPFFPIDPFGRDRAAAPTELAEVGLGPRHAAATVERSNNQYWTGRID